MTKTNELLFTAPHPHAQSRRLRLLSRSCGAKIAYEDEVPASQSDFRMNIACLHTSMTLAVLILKSAENCNTNIVHYIIFYLYRGKILYII